jgi:hypothetical protein
MNSKNRIVFEVLLYGAISIAIGLFFQWVNCPYCMTKPALVIQNMGYSLMLGLGLFFNKFLYDLAIGPHISWIDNPFRAVLISFGVTTLYSGFVIFITNWLWFTAVRGMPFGTFLHELPGIWVTEFIILYFISMWFYARSFFLDWKEQIKQQEMLKREALSAKYDILKSQVSPHFLFNSLNVATSLVDKSAEKAKQFLSQLSGMYRDVLELQDKDLVSLERELKLASRYLYLQEMRFGKAFQFSLPEKDLQSFQIVPLSVQLLMENAFKHNRFSVENPMKIDVQLKEGFLVVRNSRNEHHDNRDSLKLGLDNLRGRYQYLTGQNIDIIHFDGVFEVHIPLIEVDMD